MSLGTNTQGDHVLLLREFFIVCQENHLRKKLEKCEFMKEEMEYLGFDVGYGWWKPAASKMQPLRDMPPFLHPGRLTPVQEVCASVCTKFCS